jgi:hypothetical protein
MLVSLTRAVLKALGSLILTVAILIVLVAVLLWGTVVEKNYGAAAAKFGIYGMWWFNALGLVLGLNSAAAIVLRWPWKLQHLGFVIPHVGLIVLLLGCFLSRWYGTEATLVVFEGESSDLAYKGPEQHVELAGQQRFSLKVISTDGETKPGEPIVVPFTSGPFSWDDYRRLGFLPWSLAHRDQGVLYDRDGIRLEALDYLSNSEIINVPSLNVEAAPLGPDGSESAEQAGEFQFSVKADAGPHSAGRRYGAGSEQTLAGRRISFWMSGSGEETAAFLQSRPQGPLGKLGRAVLYAGGKPYDLSLDDWTPGTRRPLGDSGVEAELVGVSEQQLGIQGDVADDVQVRLNIHRGPASHPLLLSAEFPQVLSRQDYDDEVFGSYWPGQSEKPKDGPQTKSAEKPAVPAGDASGPASESAARPVFGPPRIEFFQGADQQLYLRTWRAGQVKIAGPLKMGESGGRITAFRDTPDAVGLWFGDFQPADRPGYSARALPFDKEDDPPHLRQAKLRLTVDDRSEEFWMPCSSPNPVEKKWFKIPPELEQKTVLGEGRRVELSFAPDSFHLGYSIDLHKAWRKFDPGSKTRPSFYGSEIDLVPNEFAANSASGGPSGGPPPTFENRMVIVNAPLDFADPALPGRSYRMFQSQISLRLYNPEDYDRKPGESVYLSTFRLNYDPGRGVTYVGCLLIVAGIFVAYFVRLVKK